MHWFPRRRARRTERERSVAPQYGVAVLRQDNGELTEDVVILGPADAPAVPGPSTPSRVVARPADRPPPAPPEEQVLRTEAVDEILGRSHPADPVPGTLPPVGRPPQTRPRRR